MSSAAPADRPRAAWLRPFGLALATTATVTLLSYVLPEKYAATGVGLGFLVATYLVALRKNEPDDARRYGLSLGGLLDPEPLDARRLLRDGARALGWALGLSLLIFPAFWWGYVAWWKPLRPFAAGALPSLDEEVLGQLLVIALPEEAFYRGYLQTAFDEAWPKRVKVIGAELGLGVLVASALFAIGHLLTDVHPNRLAVFFPALVFGWLRARTGGIGAPVAFHMLCNLFAAYLARSYGLGGAG